VKLQKKRGGAATRPARRTAPASSNGTAAAAAPAVPAWQWPEATWRAAVNAVRAGRSLKPARWKDGARVCVALSFDSDHESGELREGGRSPGRLSQGQYGNRSGVPRILDLLARHEIPATFFVPAVIARLYPDEQRRVVAAGHELALHGWIHELNSALARKDERALLRKSYDTLAEITGRAPVGMRTPSWDFSPNTLALERELGLLYDSSLMADDDPYELLEAGEPTGLVELPVEWIRDDAVYFNMQRFTGLRPYTPPDAVLSIFRAEFDVALAEGGLCVYTMHPHIVGHRSRVAMLDAFIRHVKQQPGVWFATHEQVARYCLEQAGR
jgi:peptidoglycan/xylan/chitin deacetylase (PgdA/CDA1 family)